MDPILEVVDRFGRIVVLTAERWHNHILVDHAEMRDFLLLIEQTVADPDQVNHDANFSNRESYYSFSMAGKVGNRHFKVCVEYVYDQRSERHAGSIVTAYVTRSVKRNEVVKWQKTG